MPYGIIALALEINKIGTITDINISYNTIGLTVNNANGNYELVPISDIKPYLRPMSSMTEEEKEELKQEHCKDEKLYAECLTKAAQGDNSMRGKVIIHFAVDWCNKNHFDYCGLIPMGLALEAPEEMYKTE